MEVSRGRSHFEAGVALSLSSKTQTIDTNIRALGEREVLEP